MNSNGLRKREFFSQVMNKGKKCFANYLPILSPDDEFCNQCEDGLPLTFPTCGISDIFSYRFLIAKGEYFASMGRSVKLTKTDLKRFKKSRKQKMAEFYDLNPELLSFIITLLATSANGATDLARLSATCHKIFFLSRNPEILKNVNFQRISVDDYEEHHDLNDLLCLCARAGNQAAQSMLGKALLENDAFFWLMILEHDVPLLAQNAFANGLLRHQKLVRRFISDARGEDISIMRIPLQCYLIVCLGYDIAHFSGILLAVADMCSYYLEKRVNPVREVRRLPLRGVNIALPILTRPSGRAHRARVLELYDVLFNDHE
uniref:F-box domain-containing protein n=2 Tax=Helianthus annuus TaxID=4232 RepID=A0A251TJQ1_HELAN